MAFQILTTEQRTDAWRQARCGRLCGSRAADMMAKIQKGEAAARRDLRLQLVVERLTGVSQEDGYVNAEMQRGIDKEAEAFAAYEAASGQLVRRTGFLAHQTLLTGCSPDGLVGNVTGLLELKCPKSATHLRYLRAGKVPSDYLPQIMHGLWITGAEWADFCSFDDRFPTPLRLFIARVKASEVDLAAYELLVTLFLDEVDKETGDVAKLANASLESVLA